MLEEPELQHESIAGCLRAAYGLQAEQIEFLPIGYDVNTAVYRVVTGEGAAYFLKLRRAFEEISIRVPHFLLGQGTRQIIPVIETRRGNLWAFLEDYASILYPFIEGHDGWRHPLSDEQWRVFGSALKRVHSVELPVGLRQSIPVETFAPCWREMVRQFQTLVESTSFADPVAAQMAAFMRGQQDIIRHVVERAEELAGRLQSQAQERVLCHSDIHAGNLLLSRDGSLYIVDWDNPILAPKERDLMVIGAGIGGLWNSAREEAMFYAGYGEAEIDPVALTYYRFERIVQDIAAFCEQILASVEGGEDRQQGFRYFSSQFDPNAEIDIACQTDRRLLGSQG